VDQVQSRNVASGCTALSDGTEQSNTPLVHGQRQHARLSHPDADAITGDARLRKFEQRAADPIPIADGHGIVGQPINGEVLAELPVDEVAPFQSLLPVAVRFDLIDVDCALRCSPP
jgi:hypothetical protein